MCIVQLADNQGRTLDAEYAVEPDGSYLAFPTWITIGGFRVTDRSDLQVLGAWQANLRTNRGRGLT